MSDLNKNQKGIVLIYLGRRGGGLHLAKEIVEDFRSKNLYLVSILSSEREKYDGDSWPPTFEGRFSARFFVKTFGIGIVVNSFRAFFAIRKSGARNILFLMPHPADFLLRILFKLGKFKTFSVIHDLNPHPGERWPTKSYTSFCIASSTVTLCMSTHIADLIKSKFPRAHVEVFRHLNLRLKSESTFALVEDIPREINLFVFLGRIREYKGLAVLAEAWNSIKDQLGDTNLLLVAGDGPLPKIFSTLEKTILINRWLSEGELVEISKRGDVFIFPYIEATQSGLLAIPELQEKKLIISDLPGLNEYAPSQSLIVTHGNSRALADAILRIISPKMGGFDVKDSIFSARSHSLPELSDHFE